jgi:hypothetical protein
MVKIVKKIYGLPQEGRLEQEKLVKPLAIYDYHLAADTV